MARLVYVLHSYPPYHNAGAETMAHQMNRWLVGRGHEVQVLTRDPSGGDWQGISVKRRGPLRWVDRELRGSVVLTHLDETPLAETTARRLGLPLVHVLHNDRQLLFHGVTYASLIVANTAWVAAAAIPDHLAAVPSIVVHPPTFCADYTTAGPYRDSVALVNLTDGKGGPLFYELARRLPERRFLAVTGAYGIQVAPPQLPNLAVRPNRPSMAGAWERTRVLLAPSVYESYGKAAVEALASGIPVIAHPTEGLVESLGSAGIFVDRDDPDAWAAALAALDDPDAYAAASTRARARAEELEAITVAQLEELETWLEKFAASV